MVMFSGLETTVEPFRAGNQKLQLGVYRASGIDHRRIKFAGLNIFAEFGHGDSAVLGVSIGAPRSETGVSFGNTRMRPPEGSCRLRCQPGSQIRQNYHENIRPIQACVLFRDLHCAVHGRLSR